MSYTLSGQEVVHGFSTDRNKSYSKEGVYSVLALSFYFVLKSQVLFPRRDLNWLRVIIPICYMPHALNPLTHLFLTAVLQITCDWSHFTDEEFEA